MALGVVAIVVLSYLTLNRPPPPSFTAPASAAETSSATPSRAAPSPSAEREEPAAGDVPRVLVVGDGFTTAAADEAAWPELVRDALATEGRPVEVTVAAALGSGYAQPDANGVTFPVLAEQAGGDFDLLVFFGSRHDIAAAPAVSAAAGATFAAARAASPEAGLVVIGPVWTTPAPPGYILTNRDALATVAAPPGAVFVDPVAAGWFSGTAPELVTADGTRPTAEGHRYLADLLRPVIESALPAAG
jgi:hypothetical protein